MIRERYRWAIALIAVAAVAALPTGMASAKTATHGKTKAAKSAAVVTFTEPVHVATTLEGCRNDGSITFGTSGPFICPDAAYTTGNLGKGWNELDLVPFRLITSVGSQESATTDYNMIIAGDYQLNGFTGWDVVSAPAPGTGQGGSDASCSVSAATQATGPGITGGADSTIYRTLTIHQSKGTQCVFDFYMRLALGAHSYSGSSLQAYIFSAADFNGGKKTVPLPVNEIAPQSLSKDMTATRNTNTPWNLTKSATPTELSFGNVCSSSFTNTKGVSITITWTKLDAVGSGQVLLVTNVYANNPSARTITTTVSDQMYAGTDQSTALGSAFVATKDVPAHTNNYLMETDTQTVTNSATHFNDVATGTYVDTVTSVPIPGSTTGSAGADVQTGTNTNGSATVTDSESITGSGLSFKTGLPSAVTGSFIAPSEAGAAIAYTAGTYTVGPVTWSSGSQSGSGTTTFSKTVKLDPIQATSGTLSDTANLVGSDGFNTSYGPLDVSIESSASTTLRINKTIPDVLQGSETVTFTFHVKNSSNVTVASPTITFSAGETGKHVDVTDLPPGNYTVTEDTATGWNSQSDKNADLTLPSHCSNSVTFNNNFDKATAFANKVTDPTGYESGWTFTLTKPDGSTLTGTTDSSGHVVWTGGSSTSTNLNLEGTYTVSETSQTGWTETGAAQAAGSTGTVTGGTSSSATCSFTVSYPTDAGKSFGCAITNRSRGHLRVNKTFEGAALTGTEAFTFQIRDGASASAAGTIVESGTANVGNSGTINFTTALLPGHTYAICEVLQANINSSLTGYNPNGNTGVICHDFSFTPAQAANDPAVTFNVDNTPVAASARVKKVTDPTGSEAGWVMTLSGPGTPAGGEQVTTTGTGFISFTTALQDGGSYTITETSQTGWTQISASTECTFTVHYPADAARTFSCTITNKSRGTVRVVKTLNGGALGTQSFTFELRLGSQVTTSTAALETKVASSANGGVLNFTTQLIPGQTYAICELLIAGYGPDFNGYGPYNPGDNPSYLCLNFSITVAQAANTPSVTFNIDNSHQFARALTIGYWKNHGTCKKSNGSQADALGAALGAGIALGPFTVTTECQAFNLLSKTNINGVKEPGDPIYNMVAQLLGAKLNLNTGAGTCSALATAITQADGLLTAINFNGIASYTKTLTAAQAALAASLNTTLDAYNNNNLC